LYGINIWTDLSSVLSQSTRLLARQTDRHTEFSLLDLICIPRSAVKTFNKNFKKVKNVKKSVKIKKMPVNVE